MTTIDRAVDPCISQPRGRETVRQSWQLDRSTGRRVLIRVFLQTKTRQESGLDLRRKPQQEESSLQARWVSQPRLMWFTLLLSLLYKYWDKTTGGAPVYPGPTSHGETTDDPLCDTECVVTLFIIQPGRHTPWHCWLAGWAPFNETPSLAWDTC